MSSRRIRLLLVEDNPDDVVLAREAFRRVHGLELVHAAADGHEALEFLRRAPPFQTAVLPDLVLVDVNLPAMNGFEFLQILKADAGLRGVPVVVLSSSNRRLDVSRAYAAGAASYIRKPMDYTDFQALARGLEHYWRTVATLPGDVE